MNIEETVNKKNSLVKELKLVLDQLASEKVDLLCDMNLREAVISHVAMDLSS